MSIKKTVLDLVLKADQLWMDLGANIGTFSLWALAQGCRVICYEPEPDNVIILTHNLKLNSFSSGVTSFIPPYSEFTIIPCAISSTAGTMDLYICKGPYNKYRHTLYRKRGRESIPVKVLDFHQEMGKNIDHLVLKSILKAHKSIY